MNAQTVSGIKEGNMEDKEKLCKNCEYTLGGYGIPRIDHAKECMCYRKGRTIVGKEYTCKFFKPIQSSFYPIKR